MNIAGRITILLVALFMVIFSYWPPYQRGFNCSDQSIRQKFQLIWFSTKYLFFVTLILPLLIIYAIEKHITNTYPQSSCWANIKKYLLGFMLILNLTEMVKRTVGRLRPHAYDLCNLDHYCQDVGSTDKYIPQFQCETRDDYPWLVVNARLSFFSGHSALGTFAGAYLIMFIHQRYMGKRQTTPTTTTTTKSTLTLWQKCWWYTMLTTIFLLYMIPGYTQWLINWHFLTDIVAGFFTGTVCAMLVFKTVNVQ